MCAEAEMPFAVNVLLEPTFYGRPM